VGTRNITLASPCSSLLLSRNGGVNIPSPGAVEAVPGLPLEPGTFFHDVTGGVLYYALAPGQSPAVLNASAFVPTTDTLMSATNTSGHEWQGITFEMASWWQPNTPNGYVESQSSVFMCTSATPGCDGGSMEPRGSVKIAGSSNMAFVNCTFQHMGGAYALSIDQGSQACSVSGCTFSDLSGGFLKMGSVDASFAGAANTSMWDAHSVVEDNVVQGAALEYAGAAAFFGGYLYDFQLRHNTINDTGYSGVSVGWGWGEAVKPGVGGILIDSNRITNCMTILRDGGGIYVNGHTNATGNGQSFITNNWVDADDAVFAGELLLLLRQRCTRSATDTSAFKRVQGMPAAHAYRCLQCTISMVARLTGLLMGTSPPTRRWRAPFFCKTQWSVQR